MSFIKNISEINGELYFFDKARNKKILITPEEWVRQHFIEYLISEKKYSINLISQEAGIRYNKLLKRTDIIAYDRLGIPFLLVECKAQSIKITQEVINQASRYNKIIKAPYLCVTNGKETLCFQIDFDKETTTLLKEIPALE